MITPFDLRCEQALKAKGIDPCSQISRTAIRIINKIARDEHCSRKHAERAIRWYRRAYFPANGPCSCIEYIAGIDHLIGLYVNGRDLQ
jgi:hypothetical protein